MRAIWKGAISFGLVNIPVGLYSATRTTNEIKFKLLRRTDLSPIKYKRVAEEDGKEVPWDQIVKGYEYEKGDFVVLTEEDFKRVEITSNQTVDIKEFVELEKIDPMFFDEPYFLGPEKGGAKAYVILREALKRSNKVGIAKVVIKTREHLGAVKPLGEALMLELMHFAEELADPRELNLPPTKGIGQKELTMAESLIDGMSGDWEPEKHKDEYREALMRVIEEKIKSGGKATPPQKAYPKSTKVVDLISVLQESLKQAQAGKKKSTKHRRAAVAESRRTRGFRGALIVADLRPDLLAAPKFSHFREPADQHFGQQRGGDNRNGDHCADDQGPAGILELIGID